MESPLPFTTYRLPFTVYRSPLTAYRLPFTAYRSPFTTYRLPLTILPMRPLLSLIAFAVLLAGCGYKTPLYLPKPTPVAPGAAPKPGAQDTAPKPPTGQDDKKPAGDSTRQNADPGTSSPERGTESQ